MVSAPTTMSGASQNVALPTVPGTSSVGGSLVVTASAPVTTVVSIASDAAAGTAAGPPVQLQSTKRSPLDFSGVTVTPQYYVGVTNTTATPVQVNFASVTLNVNVPAGSSVALAHYDPSKPQNGWNQHCAFGSSQVTQSGSTATFSPNANLTVYPGATLWFAPYTYASATASPTPPPASNPVTPTPAPAPASLTGTYIGSALQTGGGSQYLEFQVTQSGSALSGTYAVLPSGSGQNGDFGSLSGAVSGGSVTLTATPQAGGGGGSCGSTALNATAGGLLIAGSFASNGTGCKGNGTFSVVLQTVSLPAISGTYTGTINDAKNGAGTLTFTTGQSGTVFSGTATASWPANPQAGGTNELVGFVVNSTTAYFGLIQNNQSSCAPSGTIAINGNTLNGTYAGGGGGVQSQTGCTGSGTFTISH